MFSAVASLSVVALWLGLEHLDCIRRTADLSEEVENACNKGGTKYVVRTAVSNSPCHSLIVLESMETGKKLAKRIAGAPDCVDIGWKIAVDPDGRYMAGMRPVKSRVFSKSGGI